MFAKGCPINQRSLVSGADRKKLRRNLQEAFQLTDEALDLVLPPKSGDLDLAKAPAPSRTAIYLHDKVPIAVDASGKGDIFPTVFALWRVPDVLPHVYVKHPFVSTYLVNGADLMLPGVDVRDLPAFAKGALLAVMVRGNPAPVAVGTAGMSSADATAKAAQGLKGKLVEVLQVYGDCLWSELGSKAVPNEGFLANAVVPLGTGTEALSADFDGEGDDATAAAGTTAGGAGANEGAGTAAAGDEAGAEREAAAGGAAGAGASGASAAATGLSGLSLDRGAAAPGSSATPQSRHAPEDMDELLELTLLQALSRAVKDGDLPLPGSGLWANQMLNCRPAGSTLDIKKSKHKKMSKFLAAYGGRGGLLTLKEDKHSGDMVITAVNRTHALLADFRPLPLRATAAGAGAAGADDGDGAGPAAGSGPGATGGAGAGAGTASGASGELLIEELWKAGKELRGVLDALQIRSDTLFTEKEAAEIAFDYVKHANLEANAPDPRTIVLDATLCDALFKGLVKKGEPFPTHLPKAELRECFLRRCQAQCRIRRGAEETIKKGAPPAVCISGEKKQGHRITRIVGMEPFLLDPQVVATDCQKKFACSTTVNELPDKNNRGCEVLLQGHIEGIAEFMARTYQIPKRYIEEKLPKK